MLIMKMAVVGYVVEGIIVDIIEVRKDEMHVQ